MQLGSHQISPGLHNLRPSDEKEINFSIVNILIILFGIATESIFYLKTKNLIWLNTFLKYVFPHLSEKDFP